MNQNLIQLKTKQQQNKTYPLSALRQPYTSPKPPRPIIRCTLKSFIEIGLGKYYSINNQSINHIPLHKISIVAPIHHKCFHKNLEMLKILFLKC
ncbi:hypothetical protein DERP_007858 [Dermatophagoides pteronyssinus]|uniref:Uncharacterized protein n=1 Tax=Dermatophagoides pteronyssinus TaxID=6956 RepID=A0ABQ8IT56_DERPT|nr:hypothetical protein DERP_007858 [Dermatophagoides pteronyssinus]